MGSCSTRPEQYLLHHRWIGNAFERCALDLPSDASTQPAITALCAYGLFRLPAVPAAAAVLLAALPTGTGPFMIAEFYKREAVVTSTTILMTTVGSALSVTACMALLGHFAN